MFLTIADPRGRITSFDLANLQVWALALEAVVWPPPVAMGDTPPIKNALALGLKYVVAGVSTFQTIAAIDLKGSGECEQIVAKGLDRRTVTENMELLRESLKVIINNPSHTASAAEELISKGAQLARVYHELLKALFGNNGALQATDALYQSEFESWRFCVTLSRFTLPPGMQGNGSAMANASGLGAAPGSQQLAGASLLPAAVGGSNKRPSHRQPPAAVDKPIADKPAPDGLPAALDGAGDGAPPGPLPGKT